MTDRELKLFCFAVLHLQTIYQVRQPGASFGANWLIDIVVKETGVEPAPEQRRILVDALHRVEPV